MTAMILLREWQASQVEFWKPTIFEGYDVSSFGRVRSWWIKVANKGHGKGFRAERALKPAIISGNYDDCGYNYLNLGRQYGKFPKVHRLVAQAFIPNPDNKPEVNHINGRKQDNWFGNFEWATKKRNMEHAVLIGLRDDVLPKGEGHYRAKITENDVREIRRRAAAGETFTSLAKIYKLDPSTIGDISYRRSWKHIE